VLLFRAGRRRAYAAVFDGVAAQLMPWRHRLQLAQLSVPEAEGAAGPRAFHPAAEFPALTAGLERGYAAVRAELEAHLAAAGAGEAGFGRTLQEQFLAARGGSWTKLVLYDQAASHGPQGHSDAA
jgi:hypothetical protein